MEYPKYLGNTQYTVVASNDETTIGYVYISAPVSVTVARHCVSSMFHELAHNVTDAQT